MIVGLHLEADPKTVSNVDYARVLAGSLEDPWTVSRKSPEVDSGRLVGAML
jgi:hypothetical protein